MIFRGVFQQTNKQTILSECTGTAYTKLVYGVWRFTNNSLCLPHAPSLSVCLFLWVCVVCVCFLLYLSLYPGCVVRAACFGIITIFLYAFCFFYKFNRHLCHSAYWCTHNPAHMSILLFHMHLHFSNSCVCVSPSQHAYAFPSSSTFIHIYRYIHVYVLCDDLYL